MTHAGDLVDQGLHSGAGGLGDGRRGVLGDGHRLVHSRLGDGGHHIDSLNESTSMNNTHHHLIVTYYAVDEDISDNARRDVRSAQALMTRNAEALCLSLRSVGSTTRKATSD